ncbi:signal peptide-containing protein [Theileria equi strain WA]|uniref:Signal peptide-containing protein n=1 Tax=Theileria equi strain WA TaxID=1537102 RepID=L0B0R4_THEEQ|nr:signal peptide-containing protein [Theileria equi strain WA]AFZ80851.1 signal peptide-containing protein [Theileria equi strain WA]|eukprot:XP_004830517.1 signal peptide-containing protein [Theileria equi strain WA]
MKTGTSLLILFLYILYNESFKALGLSLGRCTTQPSYKQSMIAGLKGNVEATKSCLGNACKSLVREVKDHPLSACLVGFSLCASGVQWSNLVDLKGHKASKCPLDISEDLRNILVLPESTAIGAVLVPLMYSLLRQLEEAEGTRKALRRVTVDFVALSVFRKLIGENLDTFAFIRSLHALTSIPPKGEDVLHSYYRWTIAIELLSEYLIFSEKEFSLTATAILAGIVSRSLE